MKNKSLFRLSSIALIYVWLASLALIPMLLMILTSFLQHNNHQPVIFQFTLQNYSQHSQWIYLRILLQSLALASSITLLCLIFGYPAAYLIAHLTKKNKTLAILLIMLPFWTNSLIRTYAILAILKTKGLLNSLLLTLGIIHHPLPILYTNTAVLVGCVYNLLPFMILPLYASIDKLNPRLLEAARDLGAGPIRLFNKIILPLTLPGIIAGSLLVFLPSMTLFYIPVLLGGAKSMLIGNLIQNEFLTMRNWPGGAATSVLLTLLMLSLIIAYRRYSSRKQRVELLL